MAQYSLASIFTSVKPDFKCDFDQNFSESPFKNVQGLGQEFSEFENGTNKCAFPSSFCDLGLNCTDEYVSENFCPEEGPNCVLHKKCKKFIYDDSTWSKTTVRHRV